MRLYPLIFSLPMILLLTNCKQKAASAAQLTEMPSDFVAFYENFHSDSIFQIEHIQWPLDGMRAIEIDSVRHMMETEWQPSEWLMHKPVDFSSGQFKREMVWLDSTFVTEFVRYTAADYGLERRFSKAGGEWLLIYYREMSEF